MEAEQSQYFRVARHSGESNGAPSCLKAGGLEIQEELMFPLESRGKKGPASSSRQPSTNSPELVRGSAFPPFKPSTDQTRPTHTREGNLLYSVYRFNCSSHPQNTQ